MKWFKENWLIALLIGLLVFVLTNSVVRSEKHKHEINAKSDSIAILKHEYQELEKREALAAEMISAYRFADSAYQDSLQDLRIDYFKQKQRHVKKIADLSRIPTDSLYRDVTGQLDSLSLHW